MNGLKKMLVLFLITILAGILSVLSEKLYLSDYEYHLKTKMFNRILAEKQTVMDACLEAMKPVLAMEDHHGSVSENDIFQIAEENNITILEYIDGKLVYWSDNEFDVPYLLTDTLFSKPLIFMQNGWFLTKTVEAGNEIIAGLLRIRTGFGFTNDIIKNGFEKDFRLSENVSFSTDQNASEYHVKDRDGNFLFSLLFPADKEISYLYYIPLFLYLLTAILAVAFLLRLLKYLSSRINKSLAALIFISGLFILYGLFLISETPEILFLTEFFSPYSFTLNGFVPSTGHLLILSVIAALSSYVFFRDFQYPGAININNIKGISIILMYLFPAAILASMFHHIFTQLIATSGFSFESYKVLELSWYSISGFLSCVLLLLVPVFLVLRIAMSVKSSKTLVVIALQIASLIPVPIILKNESTTVIPFTVFWLLTSLTVWFMGHRKNTLFNASVIISLLTAVYALYYITVLSDEKTTENIKIQAVAFSTENDPEAEHLLLDMWPEISNDTILRDMMISESFNKNREDVEGIYTYLSDRYFSGYWGNYNFSIVPCSNSEMLQIGAVSANRENCFGFFDSRIRQNGHRLTGTEFYFIDNQGGRAYYLGRLLYDAGRNKVHGLFLELYSDVNIFQPGYSELLLDKKYHKYSGVKDYSFAKYINGDIVLQNGDFPYDKTDVGYIGKVSDYRIFSSDGFKHVLYRNGTATVIISRPELTAGNLVISFAYLFAFIFIFFNLVILIARMPGLKKLTSLNFRQKLQISYMGILLISFIMIGVVVSVLTIREYRSRHSENMKEKLNSIYMELESKLGNENRLSSDWRDISYPNLNAFLVKLSNIFNTDINLYDLNGYIMATSRQEIFFRDLLSRRINNMAWINIRDFTRSEYYQKEKIGNLQYMSAYIPFYNSDGKMLAYLNLPYFRMQSMITNEISNLIVAVINFTLLLVVITMGFSVLISRRMTAPLSMLSEGLASVELGKKTEHLSYSGNDEIGDLVKKYNRMLDELEDSAAKLANSEREYAWREMAKQIAHEIKNPLTPMKLNVQQLLRSWNDKAPDFGKKIESFAQNQVEYIDNLSAIATAFSSFAKMPGNNPAEVDLTDQIRTSLELFRSSDYVRFDVHWPEQRKIIVFADKEHLNGIFSNLIKNAIQSIPQGVEGLIVIDIEISGNRVLVTISDNGSGIPEDIRKKMFTPNFTTKSSGTGLGLSIVKRYVENAGGSIWFESQIDKGTKFFVELPVKYTVEKPV